MGSVATKVAQRCRLLIRAATRLSIRDRRPHSGDERPSPRRRFELMSVREALAMSLTTGIKQAALHSWDGFTGVLAIAP